MSAATDQNRLHATAAQWAIGERVTVAYERQERLLEAPLALFLSGSCKQYSPGINTTPVQRAQLEANPLQYAQSLRSHGVTNFPDPCTGPSGESGFDPNGLGIDPTSPIFQAAHKACHGIVSGSK